MPQIAYAFALSYSAGTFSWLFQMIKAFIIADHDKISKIQVFKFGHLIQNTVESSNMLRQLTKWNKGSFVVKLCKN